MMWKVENIVSKGDYNYAVVPDHPNSTKNNYVLEHRIVAENNLGRQLKNNEVVHHINNNKKDNRWENLEVLKHDEHSRLHGDEKTTTYCKLKCPECLKIFERERGQTFLVKPTDATFCSRSCNGKFYHREKDEIQERLNENLIKVYEK